MLCEYGGNAMTTLWEQHGNTVATPQEYSWEYYGNTNPRYLQIKPDAPNMAIETQICVDMFRHGQICLNMVRYAQILSDVSRCSQTVQICPIWSDMYTYYQTCLEIQPDSLNMDRYVQISLDTCQEYFGNTLGTLCQYSGNIVRIRWECSDNPLGIIWEYSRNVLGILWEYSVYSGNALGILWECSEHFLGTS